MPPPPRARFFSSGGEEIGSGAVVASTGDVTAESPAPRVGDRSRILFDLVLGAGRAEKMKRRRRRQHENGAVGAPDQLADRLSGDESRERTAAVTSRHEEIGSELVRKRQ